MINNHESPVDHRFSWKHKPAGSGQCDRICRNDLSPLPAAWATKRTLEPVGGTAVMQATTEEGCR